MEKFSTATKVIFFCERNRMANFSIHVSPNSKLQLKSQNQIPQKQTDAWSEFDQTDALSRSVENFEKKNLTEKIHEKKKKIMPIKLSCNMLGFKFVPRT